jgi:hypothetical protein
MPSPTKTDKLELLLNRRQKRVARLELELSNAKKDVESTEFRIWKASR